MLSRIKTKSETGCLPASYYDFFLTKSTLWKIYQFGKNSLVWQALPKRCEKTMLKGQFIKATMFTSKCEQNIKMEHLNLVTLLLL